MEKNIILEGLNEPQKQAVLQLDGPLLILAGAGSGKTRVITHRIAYGLQQGIIQPEQFLAVTFTNKAAAEMRERVINLTGLRANQLWVKTFHSTCAAILREEAHYAGLTRYFTIYDSQDQLSLIKNIIKETSSIYEKFTPALLLNSISRAKDSGIFPEEAAKAYDDPQFQETFLHIYKEYDKRLHTADALDFGDLIFKTVELFKKEEQIRKKYCTRFPFILVDEYQDTNKAQYHFIKQLTKENRNICVVGDDDQAIYNWRGADISNILNFEKDFPEAKVVKLEQNYRSTPQILEVAGKVIQRNSSRLGKTLWSAHENGELPYYFEAKDDREEAAYVASMIQEYYDKGENYKDMAVFYRTNWQSRVIEETLVRSKIPYSLTGGVRFYERKEIKDLMAYLRLTVNQADELAFIRAVGTPTRGVGKQTQKKLLHFAQQNSLSLIEACLRCEECTTIKGKKAIQSLLEFGNIFQAIQAAETPYEAVNETILLSGLTDFYETERERVENIIEFTNGVKEFQDTHPEHSLADFLVDIALLTGSDLSSGKKEGVQLMTIHNAKGLEFATVFITGLEQGLFPHFLSSEAESGVEEERRLFYVGVTRAKQNLHLTHAAQRLAYGKISYNDVSQFLNEVPLTLLHAAKAGKKVVSKTREHLLIKKKSSSKKQAAKLSFSPGDKVTHPEYGPGVVTSKQGSGPMARVHVEFEGRNCLFIEQYSKLSPTNQ